MDLSNGVGLFFYAPNNRFLDAGTLSINEIYTNSSEARADLRVFVDSAEAEARTQDLQLFGRD